MLFNFFVISTFQKLTGSMRSFVSISLIIAHLLIYSCCFAQPSKIDSLLKVLPALKDTARIDCLHEISLKYLYRSNKDSARYYTNLGYEESKKTDYIHGIAVAFCCRSLIAKHFDDDYIQSEKLAKESLKWFEKTSNKEGIDTAYSYLTYAVFSESKFDEAAYYTKKELDFAKEHGQQEMMFDALGWMFSIYRQ